MIYTLISNKKYLHRNRIMLDQISRYHGAAKLIHKINRFWVAVTIILVHLCVTSYFSLGAFERVSSSFVFNNFTMLFLGVDPFVFILTGTC